MPYEHEPAAEGESAEPGFTILNEKSLAYYEGLKEKGEPFAAGGTGNIGMSDVPEDFDAGIPESFVIGNEGVEEPFVAGNAGEPETVSERKKQQQSAGRNDRAADSISYRLFHWKFSVKQKEEVKRAMAVRVPKEVILSYFYPETSVVRMMEIHRRYE